MLRVVDRLHTGFDAIGAGILSSWVAEAVVWVVFALAGGLALTKATNRYLIVAMITAGIGSIVGLRVLRVRDKQYAVYECGACAKRFIGESLKPFSYANFRG